MFIPLGSIFRLKNSYVLWKFSKVVMSKNKILVKINNEDLMKLSELAVQTVE